MLNRHRKQLKATDSGILKKSTTVQPMSSIHLMNYIKKLEVNNCAYTEQVLDARDNLDNLRAYLQSSKFHEDPTIQVQDVLNRLESLRECLTDTYFDIKEEKYKELV